MDEQANITILNYPNTNEFDMTRRQEFWCNLNQRTTDQAHNSSKFEHRKIVRFQSFCD